MKAILEFNLPEDLYEYVLTTNSSNMRRMLFDFSETLRSWEKHGHDFVDPDDAVSKIREYFIQCLNDYEIKLD